MTTLPTPASDGNVIANNVRAREDRSWKPFVGTLIAHEDYGILRITQVDGNAVIARVVYNEDGPTDGDATGAKAFVIGFDDVALLAQNGPWNHQRYIRTIAVEHRGDRLTVHQLADVAISHNGCFLQVREVWDSINGETRSGKVHSITPGELTLIDTFGTVVPADRMRVSLPADLADDADAETWAEDLDADLDSPIGLHAEAVDLLRMHREVVRRLKRIDEYNAQSAVESQDDFSNYLESLVLNTLHGLHDADLDDRFPMPAAAELASESDHADHANDTTAESEAA